MLSKIGKKTSAFRINFVNTLDNMAAKNVDKRTFRKEHAQEFTRNVTQWRSTLKPQTEMSKHLIHDPNVKICVRKRPLFDHEVRDQETDMITCNGAYHLTVHDARMHPDCRRGFINHVTFPFHRVYDEMTTNNAVFEDSIKPLVQLALDGGKAVAFMFGQTGSGKTFTMTAMQNMTAQYLFDAIAQSGIEASVSLAMFEVAGSECADLLAARAPVVMRDDGKGVFQACGLTDSAVISPETLLTAWEAGRALRATEATDINSVSSRSHAVSRIRIALPATPKGKAVVGELMLVDLAGSERKEDSMFHSAERRRECASINSSLMTLKECIRLRATPGAHLPFRESILTQVLKDALVPGSRTATTVIATVAPGSSDIEHSICTLRHVTVMSGAEAGVREEKVEADMRIGESFESKVPTAPARWQFEDITKWLEGLQGGAFADCVERVPKGFTGALLTKMGPSQFARLGGDSTRGEILQKALQQAVKDAKDAREASAKQSREDQDRRKVEVLGAKTSKVPVALKGKENDMQPA